MSVFLLRPARSTDAGAVGAILSSFVDETEWLPRVHTRAQDVSHAAQMIDRGWVTKVERDGTVIGFSARDADRVHALYVTASFRGQGCGAVLLRAMQRAAPELTLWTFQANTSAQAFYLRHGFVERERSDGHDNDERLPDICLGWTRKTG